MTAYRDETETLRAHVQQLREDKAGLEGQVAFLRKQQASQWSSRLMGLSWRALLGVAVFGASVGCCVVGASSCERSERATADTARTRHQHRLEQLRLETMPGVPQATWLWCIDHCVRYSGDPSVAQGIVVGLTPDYSPDSDAHHARHLISVRGPWLSGGREGALVYSDAPVAVGDVVIISGLFAQQATVEVVHPEALGEATP